MRGAVLAAVTALLAAACGASDHPHPSDSPSGSIAPPSFSAPSAASGVPGSSGPAGPPAVAGCPPNAVTAAAAPFCYPLPDGFTDFSTRDNYAFGWTWRTLISAGPHDLIQVIGQPVEADLDKLDAAAALAFAKQLQLQVGALGVTATTPLIATTVGGARAFEQDATYQDGIAAHSYTVFSGHNVIEISCQFSPDRSALIDATCSELRRKIVIG